MKSRLTAMVFGDFTMRRRLARLLAVGIGAAIAASLAGGVGQNSSVTSHRPHFLTTTNKNVTVKGPEPYAGMFVSALQEAKVPVIDKIRVTVNPPAGCEGAFGCTDPAWTKVYVYKHQSPLQMQVTFLHEMGHQYDFRVMDGVDRSNIKAALGWSRDWPWWDSRGQWGPNGTEWGPPGEVFAEAYAWCAVGVYPGTNRKAYGWQPTREAYERVCQAILETD